MIVSWSHIKAQLALSRYRGCYRWPNSVLSYQTSPTCLPLTTWPAPGPATVAVTLSSACKYAQARPRPRLARANILCFHQFDLCWVFAIWLISCSTASNKLFDLPKDECLIVFWWRVQYIWPPLHQKEHKSIIHIHPIPIHLYDV